MALADPAQALSDAGVCAQAVPPLVEWERTDGAEVDGDRFTSTLEGQVAVKSPAPLRDGDGTHMWWVLRDGDGIVVRGTAIERVGVCRADHPVGNGLGNAGEMYGREAELEVRLRADPLALLLTFRSLAGEEIQGIPQGEVVEITPL
eukprot:gene13904-26700_t